MVCWGRFLSVFLLQLQGDHSLLARICFNSVLQYAPLYQNFRNNQAEGKVPSRERAHMMWARFDIQRKRFIRDV